MRNRNRSSSRRGYALPSLVGLVCSTVFLGQVDSCFNIPNLIEQEVSRQVPREIDEAMQAIEDDPEVRGLDCWDTNGNGVGDQDEDTNGDRRWDALDCQGEDGDSGPPGETGKAGEDGENGDQGRQGDSGEGGADGKDGKDGLRCWDLNGNGVADLPDEDTNGDNEVDVYDCRGGDLACADCDDRFVNEGQQNSITTPMIANRAITREKVSSAGQNAGKVLKADGAGGVTWSDDEIGNPGTGDITAVHANDGLTGGATSGDAPLSVGAGAGIAVGADTVSIDANWTDSRYVNEGQPNSINSTMIPDGTVGSSEVADNSLTANDLASNSVGLSELNASGGSSGRYLKHTGSGMVWDDPATGVTDHGQLTGLGDDDHSQYLPVTRSSSEAQFDGKLKVRNSTSSPNIELSASGVSGVATLNYSEDQTLDIRGNNSIYLAVDFDVNVTNTGFTQWRAIRASDFIPMSSRAVKKNIEKLGADEKRHWLAMIATLRPSRYLFNWERIVAGPPVDPGDRQTARLGLIADELPPELLGPKGDGVDLYALTTATLAAVQEMKAQIDRQEETIRSLENEIARLRGE